MAIIIESYFAVFNCQQKEKDSLLEYTQRFKTAVKVFESHIGGPIALKKYVKTMDSYANNLDEENMDALYDKASKMAITYLYLRNLDQAKYCTIMHNLNEQKSLGNNQYPKTLSKASQVLSNCHFDGSKNKNNKSNNNNNNNQNNSNKLTKIQFNNNNNNPAMIFMMQGRCYFCGKVRHKLLECRFKD